jgi:hypothetical protein
MTRGRSIVGGSVVGNGRFGKSVFVAAVNARDGTLGMRG